MKRESRSANAARLLPVREVSGIGDDVHTRAGNLGTPGLAVCCADDAILLAPQQQGRDVDAVQPALQMRVVHVGLPAEPRERLAAARDSGKLRLRQLHQVAFALRGIGPGEAHYSSREIACMSAMSRSV